MDLDLHIILVLELQPQLMVSLDLMIVQSHLALLVQEIMELMVIIVVDGLMFLMQLILLVLVQVQEVS